MTQQQEHLWTDEQVAQLAVDGEKIWMMGNVGLRNVLFRQLEKLRASYETALAARDERIKALEQYVKDNDEDCAMQLGLMAMDRDKALADCDQLRQQLAEAQRWTPIADNDVTRGFAAMLVFNGLRDYADCRVCRLADAAQEE